MIQKMTNIKPIIGDDEPFITSYYRDVPNGFRIADIDDTFLEPYLMELESYYSDFEIVGETYTKFFKNLNLAWERKKEIVKKYANYDKTKIHYTYDTENNRTVSYSESGDSTNENESTDTHIDTPISNNDSTPSNIDTNESTNNGDYNREYTQTENITLDDGNIDKVNELTEKYLSVLDVLINTFKDCFVRFESYTY